MYNLTKKKKSVTNSIYYAIFHNHLKIGNPEGINGEQKIKNKVQNNRWEFSQLTRIKRSKKCSERTQNEKRI